MFLDSAHASFSQNALREFQAQGLADIMEHVEHGELVSPSLRRLARFLVRDSSYTVGEMEPVVAFKRYVATVTHRGITQKLWRMYQHEGSVTKTYVDEIARYVGNQMFKGWLDVYSRDNGMDMGSLIHVGSLQVSHASQEEILRGSLLMDDLAPYLDAAANSLVPQAYEGLHRWLLRKGKIKGDKNLGWDKSFQFVENLKWMSSGLFRQTELELFVKHSDHWTNQRKSINQTMVMNQLLQIAQNQPLYRGFVQAAAQQKIKPSQVHAFFDVMLQASKSRARPSMAPVLYHKESRERIRAIHILTNEIMYVPDPSQIPLDALMALIGKADGPQDENPRVQDHMIRNMRVLSGHFRPEHLDQIEQRLLHSATISDAKNPISSGFIGRAASLQTRVRTVLNRFKM